MLFSAAAGGALLQLALYFAGAPLLAWDLWTGFVVAVGLAGALSGTAYAHRSIGRLKIVANFLESEVDGQDDLRRLPRMGRDEVGRTAEAVNEVLASMTSLRGDMIDQGRELEETQRELQLKADLAAKSDELATRLAERALLYDVLREAASGHDLDRILENLVTLLGPELKLREMALLLRETVGDEERFVVRAVYGFEHPEDVVGRFILSGEGIAGEAAQNGHSILVPDVAAEPHYLAFWGRAKRQGAFAAFPIRLGGDFVGILAMTRPKAQSLDDARRRFLSALAHQVGLTIRHAQLVDDLRASATHDDLTGLANRRLLKARLERELLRARRFEHSVSVLALDIDHFKKLNDRCGHPTGDRALEALSRAMLDSIRRVDTAARVGGEEFVVLLPLAGLAEAAQVAEKMRARVAEASLPGGEGQPGGHLTVSIGVATLGPEETGESFLARADRALYAAKESGRNRVVQA